MFDFVLITAVTLLNAYVLWRAASVPFIIRHIPRNFFIVIGIASWLIVVLGRLYGHESPGKAAVVLEIVGLNWMAVIFLMFAATLTIDVVTGFGLFLRRIAPLLRGVALAAGALLSIIGFVQGFRPPVVVEH